MTHTHEEESAQLKEQLREVLEQLGTVSEQLSQIRERESQLWEQLRAEQAEKHLLQESLAVAHKRIEELEKQPRKNVMPSTIAHGVGK